ncbi:MAG: GntR family transcriptional regulator [Amylibacter sp.]|nr:GntR family transcriptional regulator [Amylibacter sp.]
MDGERLPTERTMASEIGISVGTLRKSLAELEKVGLLERRQGSGNYVRAKSDAESVYAFFRIELLNGGGLPSADILSVRRLEKPAEFPLFGSTKEGHRIRRLRYLNETPVAVEEIWLDAGYVDEIQTDDLSDSLYLYYKSQLGVWIARAEDCVSIDTAPDWSVAAFGPRPGEPCGYIERISWDQDNQSAEFSRTWFDASKARYVTRIR